MASTELTFNDYVRLTLTENENPFELRLKPFVDIESGNIVGFRTNTTIHSITLGELKEEQFFEVGNKSDFAKDILKHSIIHAIRIYKEFKKKDYEIKIITVRCPISLVENESLHEIVSSVLKSNKSFPREKLCLEFSSDLLKINQKTAKTAVLDMKLLKVKTMITGCGKDDFQLTNLLTVTPNVVLLDKDTTAYAGNRNKPEMLSSLISYVRSMGSEVIAEGTERQRKIMRNQDCFAFFVSDTKEISLLLALDKMREEEEE